MNGRARHWATVIVSGVVLALGILLVILAFGVIGSVIVDEWSDAEPIRTEFQYESGLECVQVVLGDQVALSCTYPPGEARFGSFLDQFTEQP